MDKGTEKMSLLSSITIPSWLSKGVGWVGFFLLPIKTTMIAVSAVVILDLVTGIWAAKKRGEKISSAGFRRTVSKTVAYQLAIIGSLMMENYFLQGIPVVKVVAGLIGVTEFKSLLENLGSVTGLDFWTAIVDKIQGQKIQPEPKETPKVDSPEDEKS